MGCEGQVVAIHVAATPGEAMQAVGAVEAIEGVGLAGDRYAAGAGTYSADAGPQRQVTLIESEALAAIAAESGIELAPGATRRNITTRGVALNHLVGREFTVGGARLRGVELCEPCGYLQRTLGVNRLVHALTHRAGLNAEVLRGGEIRAGDAVVAD
jgi:MOSC domain-containing protein YiiM